MIAGGLFKPKITRDLIKSNVVRKFPFSGSHSLEIFLTLRAREFPMKKSVMISSYQCYDLERVILKCGLTPVFVNVEDSLNVDVESFLSSMKNNVLAIVLTRYFGYKDINLNFFKKVAWEQNILVIEDYVGVARSFKNLVFEDTSSLKFNSLRKFLPLLSGSETNLSFEELPEMLEPRISEELIRILHNGCLNDKDLFFSQEEFDVVDNFYNENKYTTGIVSIDKYSQAIYDQLNLANLENSRKDNYLKLKKLFTEDVSSFPFVELLRENDPDDLPLHFVIRVKKNRDELRKYLKSKNILTPVHWIDNVSGSINSKVSSKLKSQLLSIPIDYRASSETLEIITQSIKLFFLKS